MSQRASVSRQVAPQPLILASSSASSMSRTNSESSSKRDSAVGIGSLVQRISKRGGRPVSDPETMAPVYRLYPHQASNGRRELRAMERPEGDRPLTAASGRSRSKGRLSSVDNTRVLGTPPPADAAADTQVEDFQKRYNGRHAYTQSESQVSRTESLRIPASGRELGSLDFSDLDHAANGAATAGPDSSKRGIHIPTRTSSSSVRRMPMQPLVPHSSPPSANRDSAGTHSSVSLSPDDGDDSFDPGARSSAGSVFSQETNATSVHTLPPLQTKGPDNTDAQYLEPVIEDDPSSWDLVGPAPEDQDIGTYALEKRAEQLFSSEHLRIIFEDPKLLLKFTGFLNTHRPKSIPILIYYLDALKAIRAINYANAIAEALEPIKGQDFTHDVARATHNSMLEEKANRAFDVLVQEDLPAYIAFTWISVVSVSIQRRITGTLAPHLREASEGLAEVFCLTDPSRTDSPIVFASEEFTRTTQYGMNYLIGRNCRFLQGPRTNPHSVRRLAIATTVHKEHTEVFINYRRDGTPFLNLLMIAPLMDSRGNVRYYIGAQVDVSGLIKDCSEMEGLIKLVEKEQELENGGEDDEDLDHKDEFQELSEMFNGAELDTVRKYGGRMHKEYVDDADHESLNSGRPRLLLKDPSQELLENSKRAPSVNGSATSTLKESINGKLEGIYQHYLLIRPAPSLRILFTSPSLRVPGILQSPFLNRIGGSSRVRADLRAALAEGRGVTAKIRWLSRPDEDGEGEGRPRWIHCTPLLGHSGAVGVWMVVLVDDEQSGSIASARRFRQAPPISNTIGGKEWDPSSASRSVERRHVNHYDKDYERRGGSMQQDYSRPHSRSQSRARRPDAPGQVLSASASEFSFNLKG